MTTFDMSEVNELAYQLPKAAAAVVPALCAVLEVGAVAVRDDLRDKAKGHPRFPAFPAAITHDVRGLTAEIGPDKNRRAGALGNILYYGTSRTPPVLESPVAALERAAGPLESAIATAGAGALERVIK